MRKTFTLIALFLLGMNYLLSQEIDTLKVKDSLLEGISPEREAKTEYFMRESKTSLANISSLKISITLL